MFTLRFPAWRLVVLALSFAWLPSLFAASCTSYALPDPPAMTARAELHLDWARDHLRRDWSGYGALDNLLEPTFDIVILSHLAIGLKNVSVLDPPRREEMAELATEVVRRALTPSVSPVGDPEGVRWFADQNLYASHLLLVLGLGRDLGARNAKPALAARLANYLRDRSSDASAHARSHPGSARWPANQALTLLALRVHDEVAGTRTSERPIARWLAWVSEHQEGSLPWSTTGDLSYARTPRGSALSAMSTYVSQFAPEAGRALYDRYRRRFALGTLGLRGFREWPPGHEGGPDAHTGPVVIGWGAVATGLGLGAARLHRDERMYAGIARLSDIVGMRLPFSARRILGPTLVQTVLFAGETATPWFEEVPRADRTEADWPVLPWIALLLVLGFDTWLLRGFRRARNHGGTRRR